MLKLLIVLSGALIGVDGSSAYPRRIPRAYRALMLSPRGRRVWICPPSRSARWAMP